MSSQNDVSVERLECEVAVIGGSLGGVAAALAVAEAGRSVVLSEADMWLGGQVTSQGVPALDEHAHIETFGGTARYTAFRKHVRAYYQQHHQAPRRMDDGHPLNPGNGWVSRLCFEPRVGLEVLLEMLRPQLRTGRIRLLLEHEPYRAVVRDERISTVMLRSSRGDIVALSAPLFLDATELGDLLPLTGAPYVSGAEAAEDTGEKHASKVGAKPDEVQSFTYGFAVDYRPGEAHVTPKPANYEYFRQQQPYALHLSPGTPHEAHYRMFSRGPNGELPFWTYRRLYDAKTLRDDQTRDLALINWVGNDYRQANLIDKAPAQRAVILEEAKQLSLGFLHWLQTEAPRDEGGYGYPELCLRKNVMGSADGLSRQPYIRESRRIVGLERVVEGDITASGPLARGKHFPNSVGIGWYQMDLHACVGSPAVTMFEPTRPFQLPLGALIPQRPHNLIASCKNIGTTHLTNGAYRLHPIEWAIGEVAGTLAAFCLDTYFTPQQVWEQPDMTLRLQLMLLERGVPLAWATDVPAEHTQFKEVQLLLLAGAILPKTTRGRRLELELDEPFSDQERAGFRQAAERLRRSGGTFDISERFAAILLNV